MRVDPRIAALRSDRTPQRQAQTEMFAVCKSWRNQPFAVRILRELDQFGQGASLEECTALHEVFTEADLAEDLITSLCRVFAPKLEDTPFGHLPFRHGFNGSSSTLLLGMSGNAQLVLQAREPDQYDYTHVSFRDALRYEAVVAGKAKGCIMRRAEIAGGGVRLFEEAIDLSRGSRLAFDCDTESLLIEQVDTRLVYLRLQRVADRPQPTQEYELASGKNVHQASGDLKSSRQDMMIALLGRMECTEAAPIMAEISLEAGEDSVRWQALREGMALDLESGFPALVAVARRHEDALAGPAGALRAQLVETYPQLLILEKKLCPA